MKTLLAIERFRFDGTISELVRSFFGSFVFGTPDFSVSDIPLQSIVDKVAKGVYKAKPARVFRFDDIREAHDAMESNQANGKMVVRI
jgi:NADPH2:quinone reductase